MTNRHCSPDGEGELLGPLPVPAITVYQDKTADLAVVASVPGVPAISLGEASTFGDVVFSAGYGVKGPVDKLTFRMGPFVYSEVILPGDTLHIPSVGYDFPTIPGDSGSPIVDAAGRLVGVRWGYLVVDGEPATQTLAVPYADVARVYRAFAALGS